MFSKGFYYHRVAIHKEDVGYVGFAWKFEGGIRYFVFLVMPFGLAQALCVFTKMLRPLIERWRGQGIQCILYIDDGIYGPRSRKETAYACFEVRQDLERPDSPSMRKNQTSSRPK